MRRGPKPSKVEVVCLQCGKIFLVFKARKRAAKYCGKVCQNQAYSEAGTVLECQHCGKQFKPSHLDAKYCGMECYRAAQRGGVIRRRESGPYFTPPPPQQRECLGCGKNFKSRGAWHRHCDDCRESSKDQVDVTMEICLNDMWE